MILEDCDPIEETLRGNDTTCQPVRLLRHPVQRHVVGFALDNVKDGIPLATIQFLLWIPAIRRLLDFEQIPL